MMVMVGSSLVLMIVIFHKGVGTVDQQIKTTILTLMCVGFGMGSQIFRDYLKGQHDEQMARIEVVRITEASKIPVEIPQKTDYTSRMAVQRVLKKQHGP